jgi:hypothetical protein
MFWALTFLIWSPFLAFYAFAAGAYYSRALLDLELLGVDRPKLEAFGEAIVWPWQMWRFRNM